METKEFPCKNFTAYEGEMMKEGRRRHLRYMTHITFCASSTVSDVSSWVTYRIFNTKGYRYCY